MYATRKKAHVFKKEVENVMLWRLVPGRLKQLWTAQELVAPYKPTPPGEDDDETMVVPYDLNVERHESYHEAK